MADTLEEIETTLAKVAEIDDDEHAHERLEASREELADLRESGEVDEERAAAIDAEIDQHLRAIGERDSYAVDSMGAADNPDDDDAA